MTDLTAIIKAAIESAPQRDATGKIDTQAMAESAAKAVKDSGWKDPDAVEVIALNAWSEGFTYVPDFKRRQTE